MSAESSEPDYTEVIDVTSLPNWNDPQVQGAFAKIDEFLADASKGVRRDLPARRLQGQDETWKLASVLNPEHACDDPMCDNGVISIDVTTSDGLERAVSIVEEAVIRAHLQADAIEDDDESWKVLEGLLEFLVTLPQRVVVGALMAVAEGAVSLIQEVQKLQGDDDGSVA